MGNYQSPGWMGSIEYGFGVGSGMFVGSLYGSTEAQACAGIGVGICKFLCCIMRVNKTAKTLHETHNIVKLAKDATPTVARVSQTAERHFVKSEGLDLCKSNVGNNNVARIEEKINQWLGKEAKMINNKAGDTVFLSKDGTRRVRFDFNNPAPHNNPHGHVEEMINSRWNKSGPIYPTDVPHN